MSAILLLLLIVPFAVALTCLVVPLAIARWLTAGCGAGCLGLVIALVPAAAHRNLALLGFLRADALSVVFMLATAFLYAAVAVYSIGYLPAGQQEHGSRYQRRFWAGLNVFAWAMLAAPMMSNLALLWTAIEVTTVVSALLVAIEDTDGAAEAAWKYVLLASAGLGLALLATIFAYYAGAHVLGQSFDLGFPQLLSVAARLPRTTMQLAFALAVLGFGTKMGLVPVHTWLPDAHSKAPTPVSALLSGSLLAISFYAILRFYQVTERAVGARYPRDVLLIFGVASLLLAALYLFGQRDLKRLLAYSSVEHMGIMAIGVSFGAPAALVGVLLHVLAHAAAKGNAFMGAGVLVRKFGTKRIRAIRGAADLLPWSGPLFLLAILALGAMPPFGLFRSEFEIVAGGLGSASYAGAAVLIVGVTVAFFGLAASATAMLLRPARAAARSERAPAAPPADAVLADTVLAETVLAGAHGATALPGHPEDLASAGADAAVAGAGGDAPVAGGDGSGTDGAPARPARGEPSGWMVAPVAAGAIVLLLLGVHPPAELTDLFARAVSLLSGRS